MFVSQAYRLSRLSIAQESYGVGIASTCSRVKHGQRLVGCSGLGSVYAAARPAEAIRTIPNTAMAVRFLRMVSSLSESAAPRGGAGLGDRRSGSQWGFTQ